MVVDASAFVEALLATPTGKAVAPRLDQEPVAVPDIFDAEVGSGLRRAHRQGKLDDEQLGAALVKLLDAPIDRIPSRLLIRSTRRWWPNVIVQDALYLWVAAVHGARVLTCDGRLARAPATGIAIENVRVIA